EPCAVAYAAALVRHSSKRNPPRLSYLMRGSKRCVGLCRIQEHMNLLYLRALDLSFGIHVIALIGAKVIQEFEVRKSRLLLYLTSSCHFHLLIHLNAAFGEEPRVHSPLMPHHHDFSKVTEHDSSCCTYSG